MSVYYSNLTSSGWYINTVYDWDYEDSLPFYFNGAVTFGKNKFSCVSRVAVFKKGSEYSYKLTISGVDLKNLLRDAGGNYYIGSFPERYDLVNIRKINLQEYFHDISYLTIVPAKMLTDSLAVASKKNKICTGGIINKLVFPSASIEASYSATSVEIIVKPNCTVKLK